ncbi:hypothetical protein CYMTET_50853 [Cymbomonas tetramitiformis]|uniref:Uncharacterized protein n=1 Tax=Cymbomonas tetramitiformis TaxID=36881 RepID=A0AAE0BM87_9CHLO|nr:hypothetical protein CYMTET_50853 [Cymbomonas tetramitiformis]
MHLPVGENLCPGATSPWKPLVDPDAPGTGRSALSNNMTTEDSASFKLPRRRRRSLQGFRTAGLGGRGGPSCDPSAPMKARQACVEEKALSRCKEEETAMSESKELKKSLEERRLSLCLQDMHKCTASRAELRSAVTQLKGIKRLASTKPNCLAHFRRPPPPDDGSTPVPGFTCQKLLSNSESGLLMGGCGERGGGPKKGCATGPSVIDELPLPTFDVLREGPFYHTCAVVGNSMNLFDVEDGEAIDEHEAVFRFNREDRRMAHVKEMNVSDLTKHIGTKTTLRFVNRKYTDSLLQEDSAAGDYDEDDVLLFWNLFSVPYLKHLQSRYDHLKMYLISSDLVNWELSVFSQLRRDMYRLGMGPFECYRFMSSGVHGLLLAMQMCGQVDVYGFSVSMDNFKESFNHGRPSESHSWDFETALMRLLYFSGAINICHA